MTETPDDPWDIRVPTWMKRAEKKLFLACIAARKEADEPLSTSELATLEDYVAARRRVYQLREDWEGRQRLDGYDKERGYHLTAPDLTIARQLDATVKLAERLAKQLGI